MCACLVLAADGREIETIERNPDPSETEVRYRLAGNLCRCTGYDKIVRAALNAAAEIRQG